MPKITVHGGPSVEGHVVVEGETGPELVPVEEAGVDPAGEGSEGSSPGSSSETSPERPPSSPETSEPTSPPHARTTGSRSGRARTGGSSAPGTGGDPEAGTSAADPKVADGA